MSDLAALSEKLDSLLAEGRHFALATVVSASGSTYRREGARAIFLPDGVALGSLSGGCLEEEISRTAGPILLDGGSLVAVFDHSRPDERHMGWGLGCPGKVEVLLEGAATAIVLADVLREALRDDRSVVVSTDLATARRVVGERVALPGWFVEEIGPPPTVLVCGEGPEADPLIRGARMLGWKAARASMASELAVPSRPFMALVCSHNFERDRDLVRGLLVSEAVYIGVIGPRSRAAELLEGLDAARVRAPAGLDLGADSPDEVALSVLAEMLAAWNGRVGGVLSGNGGPIHPRR